MTCSNCMQPLTPGTTGSALTAMQPDAISGVPSFQAALICPTCLDGAAVIKLVLRRLPAGHVAAGHFAYEQFAVLEMTKKAFGK